MSSTSTVIRNAKSMKTLVVFQPSRCIDADLSADFSLGTSYFLIKVNGTEPVELDVVYADDEITVTTLFYPGWNPDLVKKIFSNVATNIQIGY